jgi:uncharacterized ferredoxin-like protein
MTVENDALKTVAGLMILAARTAPKARGQDELLYKVLNSKEIRAISAWLAKEGDARDLAFFIRDSENFADTEACVLIGVKGNVPVGISCGACGFRTCGEYARDYAKRKQHDTDYAGPNCAVRMTDLGIAAGSAVKTAQIHNVDNRLMFTGGVAALALGFFGGECTVAYAIPLSATGKNIFFDRDGAK